MVVVGVVHMENLKALLFRKVMALYFHHIPIEAVAAGLPDGRISQPEVAWAVHNSVRVRLSAVHRILQKSATITSALIISTTRNHFGDHP